MVTPMAPNDPRERLETFVEEALAADRAIEENGQVYAAANVHSWIEELARGRNVARPRPWRE